MSDEISVDVAGLGKLAKAIPNKAWVQLVDTACRTFRECIAPITATTSGIGRLIEAKFERLVDAEKLLAADTMARAREKAAKSKKAAGGSIRPNIVIAILEAAATETDSLLRDLWSSLLAQEMVNQNVHPEFTTILSKLSPREAYFLAKVAEGHRDKNAALTAAIANILAQTVSAGIIRYGPIDTFTTEHLGNLGLIKERGTSWVLTHTGRAFIQAVTSPASE